MNTDVRSIDLNSFQRQGLETVVARLREVLRLCPDGDVSIEADEFIQQNVLGGCIETPRRKVSEVKEQRFRQQLADDGTLFAVSRLFQNLDPENTSGYSEEVQFPGSQVWTCYNYVSELVQPWNQWRAAKSQSEHGRASTSIASFLTPEEEQRRSIAFRKIHDKTEFLASILTGVKPDRSVPSSPAVTTELEALPLNGNRSDIRKPKAPKRKNMPAHIADKILIDLLRKDPPKYAGMGQRDLAKAIGCSRDTLRKLPSHQSIGVVRAELQQD